MAEYIIQGSTLDAIADAINAKTGGSSAMTPADMVTEIADIPTGMDLSNAYGAVVWDSSSTLHVYGQRLPTTAMSYNSNMTTLILEDTVEILDGQPYTCANMTTVVGGSGVQTINANTFFVCSKLESAVNFPKCTALSGTGGGWFKGCTKLTSVTLGSVGYGLTIQAEVSAAFPNCTQEGLTITIYCTGANVDTNLTKIRAGATAATIIIKASEATTYAGTSYAAGATIVTSTV